MSNEPVYELRSMIHGRFISEAKCADALMWTRQKLNKITTGRKMPDIVELSELASVLGKSLQELAEIFVARKVNERMTKVKSGDWAS